ncbi:MAG: HNH endonuclease signature motif containing protein [Thermoguttaceae bacterium]
MFLGSDGKLSTLVGTTRVAQSGGIDVFNFTVEGNHNYFVLEKDYDYGQTCVLVQNAGLYRKSSKTIRKEWEEANGKSWPKDPNNLIRNQDVSHKVPLADGGTNDLSNIEPLPHSAHMQQHIDKGDFSRWGSRPNNTKPSL